MSMKVVTLMVGFALLATGTAHAQPEGRFFDSDGVQIHYTDQGEGEPVVLIHGFSSSLAMWERSGLAPGLVASGYRVVSLDVRGHGKSGKPRDVASYGTQVLGDVVRLMDHLDLPTAHLVGYSMGGGIVLGLVARHQDRIRSAVVGGFGLVTQEYFTMRAETTAESLATMFSTRPDRASLDLDALAAIRGSYSDIFATPRNLPRISVPLTAIIGGDDEPRLSYVEQLSKLHPATLVTILPGYDHGATPDSPEFAAAVQTFLAGVGSR